MFEHLDCPLHIAIFIFFGDAAGELAADEGHTAAHELYHDLDPILYNAIDFQLLANFNHGQHSL